MRVTLQTRTREVREIGRHMRADFGDAVTARERSLPIDRLFPFGWGLRGGGLISTQLQGGRGARLAS